MKKTTLGNKSQLIGTREELAEYEGIIRRVSSTELQPCAGVNFLDGKAIGGRTLTAKEAEKAIDLAGKAGALIEEI
mgnify:CR=1 FL=1